MLRKNEVLLKQAKGGFNRPFFLVHVLPGIVPAGAGTRYQSECWAVLSQNQDGSRHGRQYATLEMATNDFNAYTTPIVEKTA